MKKRSVSKFLKQKLYKRLEWQRINGTHSFVSKHLLSGLKYAIIEDGEPFYFRIEITKNGTLLHSKRIESLPSYAMFLCKRYHKKLFSRKRLSSDY